MVFEQGPGRVGDGLDPWLQSAFTEQVADQYSERYMLANLKNGLAMYFHEGRQPWMDDRQEEAAFRACAAAHKARG